MEFDFDEIMNHAVQPAREEAIEHWANALNIEMTGIGEDDVCRLREAMSRENRMATRIIAEAYSLASKGRFEEALRLVGDAQQSTRAPFFSDIYGDALDDLLSLFEEEGGASQE